MGDEPLVDALMAVPYWECQELDAAEAALRAELARRANLE